MNLIKITFPLDNPVLIFTVILFIVLLSPLLLRKINIPDIIGLIIAGIIVGPNGFNLLSGDIGLSIFGTTGLLYLMFLAGLEIDLGDFVKNKKQGTWFGLLTFILPFVFGFVVFRMIMNYDIRSSILIAIMLSSHTLVSYPIAGRLGITNHPVMTVIIAGTIIADTIVLIVLGLVSDSVSGDMSLFFWLRTIAYFGLFSIYIIIILPYLAKWFFKHQESEGGLQYIFVLTAIFFSAALAEFLKIEPLIGAFFAGLSLNKLIVRTSSLMNRIVFIGNTLFIPFFIISIGMMVDLSVLFQSINSLLILLLLIFLGLSSKFLAAFLTRKIFSYSRREQNLIFGLSVSRAASTIAIIIIGYNFKLVDEIILNNTVILILVTSLVSSMYTQRAGQKIADKYLEDDMDDGDEPERILVPVSNPATIQKLLEFSIIIKDPGSKEPIYPITVVQDGKESAEKNSLNKKMMNKALQHSSATNQLFEPITRIDLNIVDGMLRAIKELMITKVIIGWHGKATPLDIIFGTILDKLLAKTDKMILVSKMLSATELISGVHVIIPDNIDQEKGYFNLIKTIRNVSKHLNQTPVIYSNGEQIAKIQNLIDKKSIKLNIKPARIKIDQNFYNNFKESIKENDLIVFVCSRKHSISYQKTLEGLPRTINKYYHENNIIMIYPEQSVYKSGMFNLYDFNR